MKKIQTLESNEDTSPLIVGSEDAPITIVSWGSNRGAILQAMGEFEKTEGRSPFNYLHLKWVSPFPKDKVKEILTKSKYVLNVEVNYSAQMGCLIREKTGIEILDNLLKYDGRPIYPEEIIDKVNQIRGDNNL